MDQYIQRTMQQHVRQRNVYTSLHWLQQELHRVQHNHVHAMWGCTATDLGHMDSLGLLLSKRNTYPVSNLHQRAVPAVQVRPQCTVAPSTE
jgi:hypothetical protein